MATLGVILPEGKLVPTYVGTPNEKSRAKAPLGGAVRCNRTENTNSANREACAGVPWGYTGSTRLAHAELPRAYSGS